MLLKDALDIKDEIKEIRKNKRIRKRKKDIY